MTTAARACKLIACMIAIFPSPVHKIHLIDRCESIPLRYTHHTHIVVVREKIMTMCGRDYGTIFVHCLAKRFCRRCAFLVDRRRGYIIRGAHVYIFIILLIREVYYIILYYYFMTQS